MKRHHRYACTATVVAVLGAWLATGAVAQDDAHMDHGGHEDHDMSAMPPAATSGSWSYHDRDNPDVEMWERWDMVPAPASGNAFVAAGGLSLEERCALYRDNVSTIIDRTLLAACGETVPAEPTMSHDQHNDHRSE